MLHKKIRKMCRDESKRITFIRSLVSLFLSRSLARFKRAVSNQWCFSTANQAKLNTPHRTTKTASYEISFVFFFISFLFLSPPNRPDKSWNQIRFSLFSFAVFFCFNFCVFMACIKEKSRFSIKFETFWWKLSRFYCWKIKNRRAERQKEKDARKWGREVLNILSTSQRIRYAFFFIFLLKLGFFHRLCKFMKMFRLYFPAKYTGI